MWCFLVLYPFTGNYGFLVSYHGTVCIYMYSQKRIIRNLGYASLECLHYCTQEVVFHMSNHYITIHIRRCGRFPPEVRTAIPVEGRFEHVVLSCSTTSDHAIAWIERESEKALEVYTHHNTCCWFILAFFQHLINNCLINENDVQNPARLGCH